MINHSIIGAGILGLATAYKILEMQPDANVLVVEKEDSFAGHQTGNNCCVLNSGICEHGIKHKLKR